MRKLLISIALWAMPLIATETRVYTLGNNMDILFDDEINAVEYPSNAYLFDSFANVELGGRNDVKWGYGFAKLGNWSVGGYIGMPMFVSFRGMQSFGNGVIVSYHKRGLSFGLGLNLASVSRKVSENDSVVEKDFAQLIEILPSVTIYAPEGRLDITGKVGFKKRHAADVLEYEYIGPPRFMLKGRLILGDEYFGKVLTVSYFYEDHSFKRIQPAGDTTDNTLENRELNTNFGILARPNCGLTLVGLLGFDRTKAITSDTTYNKAFHLIFSFGVEKTMLDFFTLRASMRKPIWSYEEEKSGTTVQKTSFIGEPAEFVFGAGVKLRKVRFDSAISTEFLYNGLYFLTGNPSAFAYKLSVNYEF